MSYKHVIDWRKRSKIRLVEAFGGKCAICGFDSWIEALEFHHINSEEKSFSLGGIGVRKGLKNWKNIVIEARKCIMVCSNCHKGIHSGHLEIPDNIKRFDESYFDYKINYPVVLTKIIKYDKCICGKNKPITQKYCSIKCSSFSQRRVIRPSKEELIELLKHNTWIKLSKIYNVSDVAVRKWAKRYDIL